MFESVTKSIVPLEILPTGTEMPWFYTVPFLMEHFREKKFFSIWRIIKFEFGLVIHHNNTCGSKSWFSSIINNYKRKVFNLK